MRKSLIASVFILAAGAGFLTGSPVQAAEKTPEQAAQQAAESWLALVDSGDYSKSWDQSAQLIKGQVASEQFAGSLQNARGSFGKLLSRTLKSAQYAKILPGAPDGEYVVIQYQTSFEQKQSAIETITPALEKDGQWRVPGYFIK